MGRGTERAKDGVMLRHRCHPVLMAAQLTTARFISMETMRHVQVKIQTEPNQKRKKKGNAVFCGKGMLPRSQMRETMR